MRVAAVQMCASCDKARNIEVADRLVGEAVDRGSELVVLPELWNLLGPSDQMLAEAEDLGGESIDWARRAARSSGVWLLAGSITERIPGQDRVHNTSCLLAPDGEMAATYRKIHLFDNEVPGAAYRESATVVAGGSIIAANVDAGSEAPLRLGMSICYDLRFPELFRILVLRGVQAIALPSAFTFSTGAAHWEVLVRARAIENQVFMVAPNQFGRTGAGVTCWGHSTIVDPWGVQLAVAPDGESVAVADLDLEGLEAVRQKLPSLAGRRPESYEWPDTSPGARGSG